MIRLVGAIRQLLLVGLLSASVTAAAQSVPLSSSFEQRVTEARASIVDNPATAIAKVSALAAMGDDSRGGDRRIRLATVAWLRAELLLRQGDNDAAAQQIARALSLLRGLKQPIQLMGDVLVTKGLYDRGNADVAGALDDYQRAHRLFERLGDARSEARSLLFIAFLYGDANDQLSTIRYATQARDVYRGDPMISLTVANTLAQAYKDLHRYPASERQLDDALTIARGMHSPGLEAHLLRNIARVQLLAGKPASANATIREALRVAGRNGGEEAPFLWATAAQAALQDGNLALAKDLIHRSFAGTDLAHTSIDFRENHQTAYDIFHRTGDAADALAHLAALKRLDDQAVTLATSANTALMGARFDFANQELRITKLKAGELARNVADERAQARTQRLIFLGIAGTTLVIIVLLGIGLVTIRRSRNEVREANTGLAESNGALAKALAAKTEFLATTSHEIRTPLNGILGMTQVMLADRGLDGATRDRVTLVHGAGVTMRALVDDILDVAKMETGNLTIEAVPMELCATLGEVCRLWAEQARAKGLDFTLDLDGCPARIVGDPARLRQIVFNLLANALKFTARGAILVRACADASTQHYSVAITDTGIGIPADKLETIFESFRQADAGTTRQFGGTGLGLAICRNLARAMGGDVSVASVPGSGSTFTLTLPLIVAERAEPAVCATAEAMLVVDRNPIARGMFKALFTPHVAELRFATGIDEAVTTVAAGGIARLLLDDTGLRGEPAPAEAIERLAKSGVPIVLLWPGDRLDEIAVLREDESTQVITKPISKKDLVNTLFIDRLRHDDMLASQAA